MANERKRLDKRTLAVLGIVLGIEAIACAGVAMSVHNKKAAMEQTLAGKETALSNVRTVSAGLPGLQAQYEKMQAQVQNLEKGLPAVEYIPTLLGDVERTAIASGVKIQEFRPKPVAIGPAAAQEAAPANATTQQQFDMTVTGNYGQIQKYLKSLTKFRKILALNSIKLQPAVGGKGGVSPQLTATLTLTAYVLPPITDSVPGAPNLPAGTTAESLAGSAAPTAKTLAAKQTVNAAQAAPRG